MKTRNRTFQPFQPCWRRGQTKVESAFALALLLIAGFCAWALYGPPIRTTTHEMIEYYFGAQDGNGAEDSAAG